MFSRFTYYRLEYVLLCSFNNLFALSSQDTVLALDSFPVNELEILGKHGSMYFLVIVSFSFVSRSELCFVFVVSMKDISVAQIM